VFVVLQRYVVVLIIGILAAIAIPMFIGQRNQAREAAQSDLRNAAAAATACSADARHQDGGARYTFSTATGRVEEK
jgi:type IV pilus assembly protein PilA